MKPEQQEAWEKLLRDIDRARQAVVHSALVWIQTKEIDAELSALDQLQEDAKKLDELTKQASEFTP